MLDYYDSLQKIVDENEGYIENVNNNYNAYHVVKGCNLHHRRREGL